MRRIASILVVFAVTIGLPSNKPVAAARATNLAGITVVHGDRPGTALVHLPQDVDLAATNHSPVDKQPPVMHAGNGRILAFVLSKANPDKSGFRPTYASWRVGRCLKKRCSAARDWALINVVDNLRTGILPAGLYRLYFVADGAPARVRLEFGGLSGKVNVYPRGPITADVSALGPNLQGDGGNGVFSGGASTHLRGSGFSALSMWVDGDGQPAEGRMGQCIHKNAPPEDRLAYTPACVGSDDRDTQELRAYRNDASWWEPRFRLWHGVTGWYVTPSPVKRAGAIALWIKF